MFEAYKVGITIGLTNHVSRALLGMQRDFARTDAHALKLKNTLHSIERLALGGALAGGLGLALAAPLKAGYEAAKRYEQALNQFKALSLGEAVNRDADQFAKGSNVIGASATDLIHTVRDLHTALGDYGMAKALGAQVAQMKFANQAVFGGKGMDFSDRQLQAMEKIIEMKGGFHGPQQFMAQADMMQKVISGTGGMVKPSDYLQFIKTAGVSGRLLSNESFYYAMEPLIQEMSGGRVGTGTMSAYNNLAQGKSTVRAANEMMRLGILDPSMVEYTKIGTVKQIRPGALRDMDKYTSDPFAWLKETLLPAMAGKGITQEKDVLNEMGAIFGNRTGSSLFSLMYLQQEKIAKNMAISKNAMGVDQLTKLAMKSPQGAEMALGAAWENLKATFGHTVIPVVLPALLGLRSALESFRQWAERNPAAMRALTYALGGLAGALLFSGAVWTLKAAFLGLNAVLGAGGLLKVIGVGKGVGLIGSVAELGLALGALAAPVAVLMAALQYHQQVAGAIDGTSVGRKVGDGLMRLRDAWNDPNTGAGATFSPPPRSAATPQLSGTLRVERGELLVDYVSKGQEKQMNRPASSAGYFDIGAGMASPSASFAR